MRVSRQDLVEALERTARGDLAAFKMVYAATSVKLYGIIIRIYWRSDLADQVGGGFRARALDPVPACRSLAGTTGRAARGLQAASRDLSWQ